ncbi:MAG: ceramidase domain-containing protein [Thiobacillus sp.]|nr:ceramidase domain-containing protein [Thiobacillus sp.]
MPAFDLRASLLMAAVLIGVGALVWVGPIAQDLRYHQFADTRALGGLLNFWNVVSNLPFLLVGMLGLLRVPRLTHEATRTGYAVVCMSIAVVALGSAYYHAAPSNGTLLWDRLPMTVVFMALLSLVLDERVFPQPRPWVMWALIAAGVASALYWAWSETQGQGDLRPYVLVQFSPVVLIPLILLSYPPRYLKSIWLVAAFGCYVAAKLLEQFDAQIWTATGVAGGHALKHVAAAAAVLCIVYAVPITRGGYARGRHISD